MKQKYNKPITELESIDPVNKYCIAPGSGGGQKPTGQHAFIETDEIDFTW